MMSSSHTIQLDELRKEILRCRQCGLARTRQHVIFGEGNEQAPIMVIAEAPGRDEDREGRPFVGRSGQLFDKICDACGFTRRQHVFISNIVKCRPPDNRTPTGQEIEVCLPWLIRQIELIDPKILILLGATALRTMAGSNYRITRVRGTWLTVCDRPALPVYHPAALLRNPALKRETWEDYKNIVATYRELVDRHHYSAHV
ncbi:MAG: uracil-DNA glycosylase [Desulfobulbaceae bacterium]|nr:uracil-DNA glycosylase [Desulfobulbaceae bacterium]